jgi:hypothetical protein
MRTLAEKRAQVLTAIDSSMGAEAAHFGALWPTLGALECAGRPQSAPKCAASAPILNRYVARRYVCFSAKVRMGAAFLFSGLGGSPVRRQSHSPKWPRRRGDSDNLKPESLPLGKPVHQARLPERAPTPAEAAMYRRLARDPIPHTAAYFANLVARVEAGWIQHC